jgi:hypothetical protein
VSGALIRLSGVLHKAPREPLHRPSCCRRYFIALAGRRLIAESRSKAHGRVFNKGTPNTAAGVTYMRFKLTKWLSSALAIGATAFLAALAERQEDSVRERALGPDQVIQRPEESKVLTGKERLGNKWMDEQRVDNCKVPIDRRGTKPRPDTCSHAPAK